MGNLPWAEKRPHTLIVLATDFQQRRMAEEIALFAEGCGFTQVLAIRKTAP